MKRTPFQKPTIEQVREKRQKAQERAIQRVSTPKPRKSHPVPSQGHVGRKPIKRKYTKASAKRRKKGEWSTSSADNYFSKWVRERDGKCLKCGIKEFLSCSHYFGRRHSATRFDPDNCIALCYGPYSNHCHEQWEGPKNEYTQLMIKLLGQDKFIALSLKAGTTKKRNEAVAECKAFLTQLLEE